MAQNHSESINVEDNQVTIYNVAEKVFALYASDKEPIYQAITYVSQRYVLQDALAFLTLLHDLKRAGLKECYSNLVQGNIEVGYDIAWAMMWLYEEGLLDTYDWLIRDYPEASGDMAELLIIMQQEGRLTLFNQADLALIAKNPEYGGRIADALLFLRGHAKDKTVVLGIYHNIINSYPNPQNIDALEKAARMAEKIAELLIEYEPYLKQFDQDSYRLMAAYPDHATGIASAIIKLSDKGLLERYRNIIKEYPESARTFAHAIVSLQAKGLHDYRDLMTQNPENAKEIAEAVLWLNEKGLLADCADVIFAHPQLTGNFIDALQFLEQKSLLNEETVKIVKACADDRFPFSVAVAIFKLNQKDLLTDEHCKAIQLQSLYASEIADALIFADKSGLLIGSHASGNRNLILSDPKNAAVIADILTQIHRTRLFESQESISTCYRAMSDNLSELKNINDYLRLLNKKGLMVQGFKVVMSHVQHAKELVFALIQLQEQNLLNKLNIEVIQTSPQHAQSLAGALGVLHRNGIDTDDSIALIQAYPDQAKPFAEMLSIFNESDLLEPKGFLPWFIRELRQNEGNTRFGSTIVAINEILTRYDRNFCNIPYLNFNRLKTFTHIRSILRILDNSSQLNGDVIDSILALTEPNKFPVLRQVTEHLKRLSRAGVLEVLENSTKLIDLLVSQPSYGGNVLNILTFLKHQGLLECALENLDFAQWFLEPVFVSKMAQHIEKFDPEEVDTPSDLVQFKRLLPEAILASHEVESGKDCSKIQPLMFADHPVCFAKFRAISGISFQPILSIEQEVDRADTGHDNLPPAQVARNSSLNEQDFSAQDDNTLYGKTEERNDDNQNLTESNQTGRVDSSDELIKNKKFRIICTKKRASSYSRVFNTHTSTTDNSSRDQLLIKKSKALLADYVNKGQGLKRFFYGHWRRHHVETVKQFLVSFNNNEQQPLSDFIQQLADFYNQLNEEGKKLNSNGALNSRMSFIFGEFEIQKLQTGAAPVA